MVIMFIGWVLHELIFKYKELSKATREIMAKASGKNCVLSEKGQTTQSENF